MKWTLVWDLPLENLDSMDYDSLSLMKVVHSPVLKQLSVIQTSNSKLEFSVCLDVGFQFSVPTQNFSQVPTEYVLI